MNEVRHHRLSATYRDQNSSFGAASKRVWLHLIWREAAPDLVRVEVQALENGPSIAVWDLNRDLFADGLHGNFSGAADLSIKMLFGPVLGDPTRRHLIYARRGLHMVVTFLTKHAVAFLDDTYGLAWGQ